MIQYNFVTNFQDQCVLNILNIEWNPILKCEKITSYADRKPTNLMVYGA